MNGKEKKEEEEKHGEDKGTNNMRRN